MSYNRLTLESELERDEGFRESVYRCTAGKLTIGVGRNLDDVGIRPEETTALGITKASVVKNGITRAQAYALLDYDIACVEKSLDKNLPWWRSLTDNRQRVLLNMCFNMGIRTLLEFHNTLNAIKNGRYEAAVAGMGKSKWARQVGRRAVRLQAMMRTG